MIMMVDDDGSRLLDCGGQGAACGLQGRGAGTSGNRSAYNFAQNGTMFMEALSQAGSAKW